MTIKFDDWSWHAGGDFPADVPPEGGATHIGMFFAWVVLADLGENIGLDDLAEIKSLLSERKLTPGALFLQFRDGKLLDDDFNQEGKAFAAIYYQNANCYVSDYENALGGKYPTVYHVPDSWITFDILREILDARLEEWRRGVLRTNPA